MNEKKSLALASAMPLGLLNHYLSTQTEVYSGLAEKVLSSGHTSEMLVAFGMYFGLKLTEHPESTMKLGHSFFSTATLSLAELAQNRGFPGTYDPLDFAAYAVGSFGAYLVDVITE